MTKITKRIGWVVLAITEIMILYAFIFTNTDKVILIECQTGILGIVWGSVAWKNHIDYKRDTIPDYAKEL